MAKYLVTNKNDQFLGYACHDDQKTFLASRESGIKFIELTDSVFNDYKYGNKILMNPNDATEVTTVNHTNAEKDFEEEEVRVYIESLRAETALYIKSHQNCPSIWTTIKNELNNLDLSSYDYPISGYTIIHALEKKDGVTIHDETELI